MAAALVGLSVAPVGRRRVARGVHGVVLPVLLLLATIFASTIDDAHAAAPRKGGPTWEQLTQQQQQVLAPIQGEWPKLDAKRKRKWLGIAKRYPSMTASEQARLQERMREWVRLTPGEREAARARYREFEQLSPEERRSVSRKWETYQRKRTEEAARTAPDTAGIGPVPGAAGLRPH
ncbi:MAG: DUF3106 domain-containing protein [Burkholderiales bacterium]|nr:DUF3106 domain-containing protein [Burkholderiales bacterium]